jgi:hypothetical protein
VFLMSEVPLYRYASASEYCLSLIGSRRSFKTVPFSTRKLTDLHPRAQVVNFRKCHQPPDVNYIEVLAKVYVPCRLKFDT